MKMCRLLQQSLKNENLIIHFFSFPSESDGSDDEIIVKTTSWPVHKDTKNFEANDKSGGNNGTDDEVTKKAPRRPMKFHSSSEYSLTPAKSCLNNHNSSSCEHSHHKPQTSTKEANHQGNGKLI